MAGNFWEWVADRHGNYFATLPHKTIEDPRGPESGTMRALRGGVVLQERRHWFSFDRLFDTSEQAG